MRQTFKQTRPVSGAGVIGPFCGLGFDLERVVEAAQCMRVQRAEVSCVSVLSRPAAMVAPRLGGYALLVSLGREIRGR